MGPVGLFPRGASGDFWLVLNADGGGRVDSYSDAGATAQVVQPLANQHIVSAHADGVWTDGLATIGVRTSDSRVTFLPQTNPTAGSSNSTTANVVAVYRQQGLVYLSTWTLGSGQYQQEMFAMPNFGAPNMPNPTPCDVTFHDLEVMRPVEGTEMVILYDAQSCSGMSASTGISPSRFGIQLIQTDQVFGSRTGLQTTLPFSRIGRAGDGGFDLLSLSSDARDLSRVAFNRQSDGGFGEVVGSLRVITSTGFEIGDVSGGVIAGIVNGPATTNFGGVFANVAEPTVFAMSDSWATTIAPAVPGSRVVILTISPNAYVAYLGRDGLTRVARMNAANGSLF